MSEPVRQVRGSRDPYGLVERGRIAAPIAALVGLVIVALITVDLFNHPIPALPGQGNHGANGPPVAATPAPSNVVVPNPKVAIAGSLVFVKAGNVWLQTGTAARQLTTMSGGAQASSPAWSADGRWIYYVETRIGSGYWPPGGPSYYQLTYPVLVRIRPDGSGKQDVLSGLITQGTKLRFFYWIRQPSISPDGSTAAVISDGPNPGSRDTVVQFVDLARGTLQPLVQIPEDAPLGHTDPMYSADGRTIAFVHEARDGANAAPSIWLYDVASRKARQLSGTGYRNPAWSPDGRYIAATHVTATKTDVVVLNAATGGQVASITTDGASWYPVFSPSGTQLTYLHLSGQIVDLYLVDLSAANGSVSASDPQMVTESSGLDGASRPAWFGGGGSTGGASPTGSS